MYIIFQEAIHILGGCYHPGTRHTLGYTSVAQHRKKTRYCKMNVRMLKVDPAFSTDFFRFFFQLMVFAIGKVYS